MEKLEQKKNDDKSTCLQKKRKRKVKKWEWKMCFQEKRCEGMEWGFIYININIITDTINKEMGSFWQRRKLKVF